MTKLKVNFWSKLRILGHKLFWTKMNILNFLSLKKFKVAFSIKHRDV